MKHKITRTKIKRIHFMKHYVSENLEIQYYAMIRMGVLSYPCKKVRGFCPEGVLSAHLYE